MTLVLVDKSKKSPSLWAILSATTMEAAKAELAERERIPEKNIKYSIGYWESTSGVSQGRCVEEISTWARNKGLDGVVWTNLKCGFRSTRDKLPEVNDIVEHLNNLPPEQRALAEEYVRKAPAKVRTNVRDELERQLGWLSLNGNGS
ncbi:hypothetical protein [Pseudidiomarina salinarum]|uniref:hypothetical protein n=1 Tax=Pseudidiomarina salinarum TaxID=435908 RepID=UPI000F8660AC|nr:hypothetical protein [Pseudidiomarina salinarum]